MVVDMALEYKLARIFEPRDDIACTARACEYQIRWLQNGAQEAMHDDVPGERVRDLPAARREGAEGAGGVPQQA